MSSKPFVRSTSNKVVAGVCGGIATYFGVSVTFVRIAAVVLALVTHIGLLAYPALWLIMPTDEGGPSGMAQFRSWMEEGNRR